jgi:hypothetical protein
MSYVLCIRGQLSEPAVGCLGFGFSSTASVTLLVSASYSCPWPFVPGRHLSALHSVSQCIAALCTGKPEPPWRGFTTLPASLAEQVPCTWDECFVSQGCLNPAPLLMPSVSSSHAQEGLQRGWSVSVGSVPHWAPWILASKSSCVHDCDILARLFPLPHYHGVPPPTIPPGRGHAWISSLYYVYVSSRLGVSSLRFLCIFIAWVDWKSTMTSLAPFAFLRAKVIVLGVFSLGCLALFSFHQSYWKLSILLVLSKTNKFWLSIFFL